jgi:DNA-binding IclR family transcriptional regulator
MAKSSRVGGVQATAPVQAVGRALALLDALGSDQEHSLAELALRTGLHPSTAHRLLASLIQAGYAAHGTRSGHYRLGRRVFELAGGSGGFEARLRTLARPHLERLRAAVDETANLVALEGGFAVYLEQVESRHAVRLFAEPGRRVPAHSSGAGKAMLAFQDARTLERFLASAPWEPMTPHTITTAAGLREELGRVRRRGYAIDDQEYEEGVSCVGAPILDSRGIARAALSVSAPSARLQRRGLAELGGLLARHAAAISRELRAEERASA